MKTEIEPLGFFWLHAKVTLASRLTPEAVCERLDGVLPRFAIPSGEAIPRFGISPLKYFLGTMEERTFRLFGPHGFASGSRGVGSLDVRGSIEASRDGSLIHLTVQPAMAIFRCLLSCAIGIVVGGIFAVLDRVIVVPLVIMTPFGVLGAMIYVIGLLRARADLGRLVDCLQKMFAA